jgi:hypothetical protein
MRKDFPFVRSFGSRSVLPYRYPAGLRYHREQTRRSRQLSKDSLGAVPSSHLSRIGLELMLAGFAPDDEPYLGCGGALGHVNQFTALTLNLVGTFVASDLPTFSN